MRVDLTMDSGYMLDFIPIENEDTIIIRVIYIPSVNREVMNMSVDTARRVISEESNSRGWSSWLKVKEQIEMKELKSN